jgi:hypothetical protein
VRGAAVADGQRRGGWVRELRAVRESSDGRRVIFRMNGRDDKAG